MEIVVGWVVFAVLVGVAASARGRSGFGWFLIAMVISPLLGVILLIAFPARAEKLSDRDRQLGRVKDCPKCAETVKAAALICRYCGHEFAPAAAPEPPKRPERAELPVSWKSRGIR